MEFCFFFFLGIPHSNLHVMNAKSFQPIKHLGAETERAYVTLTTMDENELSVVARERKRKYEYQKYNICKMMTASLKRFSVL